MQPLKILFEQIQEMATAAIAMSPQLLISLSILFVTFKRCRYPQLIISHAL